MNALGAKLRCARRVALLIGVALLATGCHQVRGGGWIPSAANDGTKATFGFTARCNENPDVAPGFPQVFYEVGQIEWHDASRGVDLHGTVDANTFWLAVRAESCKEAHEVLEVNFGPSNSATLYGDYRPQPKGAPGRFQLDVLDNGEPGNLNGDTVRITLIGGQYNGYTNFGVIQGGNIQVD